MAVTPRAIQHGFGAGEILMTRRTPPGFRGGMFWLVLTVIMGISVLGMSFQVDELVEEDIADVTGELQKALVPLQNFLLADSDVSKVVQSANSAQAAKLRLEEQLFVGHNRRELISRLVDLEDARLGMRIIMDENVDQLRHMERILQERERDKTECCPEEARPKSEPAPEFSE